MTPTAKELVPSKESLTPYKALSTRVENQVTKMVIDSPEAYKEAGELFVMIKTKKREVVSKREEITKPINQAKAATMSLFRPYVERMDQALSVVQKKMLDYDASVEAERHVAEQEQQARVDAGADPFDAIDAVNEVPESPDKTVHVSRGNVTQRVTQEVVVVDESLIPRQYLVPDMVKIRDHAIGRGDNEARQIPGVEVRGKKGLV